MNIQNLKDKYLNQKFITIFIIIFIILFIFFSFLKFLGQWPMLLIISFFLTYYLYNNSNSQIYNLFTSVISS
jgi:uncharacterized membrane protein